MLIARRLKAKLDLLARALALSQRARKLIEREVRTLHRLAVRLKGTAEAITEYKDLAHSIGKGRRVVPIAILHCDETTGDNIEPSLLLDLLDRIAGNRLQHIHPATGQRPAPVLLKHEEYPLPRVIKNSRARIQLRRLVARLIAKNIPHLLYRVLRLMREHLSRDVTQALVALAIIDLGLVGDPTLGDTLELNSPLQPTLLRRQCIIHSKHYKDRGAIVNFTRQGEGNNDRIKSMANKFVTSTLLTACCSAPLHADFSQDKDKPNIIFFIVDDMGWQDTSLPFWRDKEGKAQKTFLNKRYRTPHMEELASQGMMFTRAYASPISSPTRTSLMTGMNAARHRVTNWTLNADQTTDMSHPTLSAPNWNSNGLQPLGTRAKGKTKLPITGEEGSYNIKKPFLTARPITEYLRKAGYITIHCGKAHWGSKGTPGANPLNLGYDYNIAGKETGGIADFRGKMRYGKGPFRVHGLRHMDKYEKENTFISEAITLESIELLNELKPKADGKPFYLYMSHYAVHVPLDARANDERFMKNYPAPNVGKHPADGKPWNLNERNYATLIEGMDKSLGDLMAWLKTNNLEKNTVIIFISDNGGLAISGRLTNANYPLRFGKGSVFEGGIRVPAIIKWPGVVAEGSESARPIIIEDFFPTLLDISKQEPRKSDGVSLVPTLRGNKSNTTRPLLFHVPNFWGASSNDGWGYGPRSALVYGDWKLIYDHATGKRELYNLDTDIGEQTDLAQSQPAKLRELTQMLHKELRNKKAQMPTVTKTKRPVPTLPR